MIKEIANIVSGKNVAFYERFTSAHHKIADEVRILPAPNGTIQSIFLEGYCLYLDLTVEFFHALFYGFRDGTSANGRAALTIEDLRRISSDEGYGLFCQVLVGMIHYSLGAERDMASQFITLVKATTASHVKADILRLSEKLATGDRQARENTIKNLLAASFPRVRADVAAHIQVVVLLAAYAALASQHLRRECDRLPHGEGDAPVQAGFDIFRVVINCPNCSSRLGLPAGSGQLQVTCPKCKWEFAHRT